MYQSSSSLAQGVTNFGIHKSDVPITILPPCASTRAQSNPNLHKNIVSQHNTMDSRSELLPPEYSFTSGRTTTFDVYPATTPAATDNGYDEAMPLGQGPASNGLPPSNRPLRVPQPPQNLHNSVLMMIPSTSSLNSNTTTTFPAGTNPPSTSSLPVFQSPPAAGVRRATPSTATLPVYNSFATSTLPNRRFPQPANGVRHSYNFGSTNSMSRADLMELAKRRQQQIEANEDLIDALQKQQHALMLAKRNGLSVKDEVNRLRGEIRRDERNLQQLGNMKRESLQIRQEAQNQRQVLQSLQNESHGKDIELRQAAGRLHLLQKQRDLMHQRRIAATNAALAQQERLSAIQRGGQATPLDELYGEVRKSQRPKVVPLQAQHHEKKEPPPYGSFNRIVMRAPHAQEKYSSTAINHQPCNQTCTTDNNSSWVLRTSAVDTFILRNDSLKAAKRRSWAHVEPGSVNAQTTPVSLPVHPVQSAAAKTHSTPPKPQIVPSSKTQATSSSVQPPPTQKDQKNQRNQRDQPPKKQRKNHNLFSNLFGRKKDSSNKHQKAVVTPMKEEASKPSINEVSTEETQKPLIELPSQAPLMERPKEERSAPVEVLESKATNEGETTMLRQEAPKAQPEAINESLEEPTKEDEVLPDPIPSESIPIEVPKSQKTEAPPVITSQPLSVKVSERTESVSPPEDPQQKQTSPTSSIESTQEETEMTTEEKKMLEATNEIMRQLNVIEDTVRVISAPRAQIDSEDDLEDDEDDSDADSDKDLYRMQHDVFIQPYSHTAYGNEEEEEQTTTEEASSNDGESSTTAEEPQFEDITRPDLKSCLKSSAETEKTKRKMQFDPWIIFLNAALEGQLDLVKENAQKIKDVSQANEEGITALHNAICAGHYDIVKYLVNEQADVNAQDSDGWTPLHCAASCNNLPIAKLLIEHGACIFATSLSDNETPAQKCEEAIKATQEVVSAPNFYDGCFAYLKMSDKCMGVVNDGKVFAAFSYRAERDDEISFSEGDELRVLNRETGERGIMSQRHFEFMYEIQLPLNEDCLWWFCEDVKTGQGGLVPRNYLCLYPSKKHQHQDFKSFELPSNQRALDVFLKQNSKPEEKDPRRDSNATLDPCDMDGNCSPDSSKSSDDVRAEDSPPPLPTPDFDSSVQISAHA